MRQDKTNSWSIQIVCRSYALKVDLLLISSLKLKSGGGLSSTILSRPWLILSYVKSMFFDVVSETEHLRTSQRSRHNGKWKRSPMQFCPYVVLYAVVSGCSWSKQTKWRPSYDAFESRIYLVTNIADQVFLTRGKTMFRSEVKMKRYC